MRKPFALVVVVALLVATSQVPVTSVAQEGYVPAEIQTVTLSYTDGTVYGDGQYIDDRGVVAEWTAPNDVAIIGSEIYIEIAPIWRPGWHEGRLSGDVELSSNGGQANGTLNKADLTVVLGVEPGGTTTTNSKMFTWGDMVKQRALMFPAGAAVILGEGEKLSLVADGMNDIMGSGNACAYYYRAYVFYINLN